MYALIKFSGVKYVDDVHNDVGVRRWSEMFLNMLKWATTKSFYPIGCQRLIVMSPKFLSCPPSYYNIQIMFFVWWAYFCRQGVPFCVPRKYIREWRRVIKSGWMLNLRMSHLTKGFTEDAPLRFNMALLVRVLGHAMYPLVSSLYKWARKQKPKVLTLQFSHRTSVQAPSIVPCCAISKDSSHHPWNQNFTHPHSNVYKKPHEISWVWGGNSIGSLISHVGTKQV